MKLLVVEDEPAAAAFLKRGLGEEGFAVDVAADGPSAREAVALTAYDAILLDVMLPETDGFALCAGWRRDGITTPVLFLTARDDVSDRVRGLNLGGDDYLVKPFAFEELLARVRALLRRGRPDAATGILHCGALTLDTHRREASIDGRTVALTAREYQLLEYLAYHAGKVVTRTQLWQHVWETGDEPDSNVVDVYIGYLRAKLGKDAIRTVRGAGYRLDG